MNMKYFIFLTYVNVYSYYRRNKNKTRFFYHVLKYTIHCTITFTLLWRADFCLKQGTETGAQQTTQLFQQLAIGIKSALEIRIP